MGVVARALVSIASKLLKTELGSTAGRVNLLGGIVVAILIGGIFIEDIGAKVLSAVLLYFSRSPLPSLSGWAILAALVVFVGYFIFCVHTISVLERQRGSQV
jgi:hypothetical protein